MEGSITLRSAQPAGNVFEEEETKRLLPCKFYEWLQLHSVDSLLTGGNSIFIE